MDFYPHLLKSACETWFRENHPKLYIKALRLSGKNQVFTRLGNLNEELPELELKIAIGPWKNVFVWFRSPGLVLSREEKECMNELRNQGNRVAVVRHMEDFKTLIYTLLLSPKELS